MPPDGLAQTAQHRRLLHRELTGQILGAFYSVYRELGCGFAESVYEGAIAREPTRLGLKADCQVPIAVHYKNRPVGMFRADILVEDLVLLELKARSALFPGA
jgi:GxxExxY protein